GLVDHVHNVLHANQLNPSSLILEITETALMENGPAAEKTLKDLHSMNVKLHIDDFGTGYSSLSYLRRFPIDALKIDRYFVHSFRDSVEIIRAIVNLSGTLGLHSIAEGVETVEQAEELRALGCEFGQGYYFSIPMAPSDIHSLQHTKLMP